MNKVFRKSTVLMLAVVVGIAAMLWRVPRRATSKKAAGGDICVLLPDTASSVRWEKFDKPALVAAFKKAG